jgi:hypothetical protein
MKLIVAISFLNLLSQGMGSGTGFYLIPGTVSALGTRMKVVMVANVCKL